MTLIVIQDLKTLKKSIEIKTKRFQYDLEQRGKFPTFPSFRFCSNTHDRKYENLRKFSFHLNFDSLKSKGCVMIQEKKN